METELVDLLGAVEHLLDSLEGRAAPKYLQETRDALKAAQCSLAGPAVTAGAEVYRRGQTSETLTCHGASGESQALAGLVGELEQARTAVNSVPDEPDLPLLEMGLQRPSTALHPLKHNVAPVRLCVVKTADDTDDVGRLDGALPEAARGDDLRATGPASQDVEDLPVEHVGQRHDLPFAVDGRANLGADLAQLGADKDFGVTDGLAHVVKITERFVGRNPSRYWIGYDAGTGEVRTSWVLEARGHQHLAAFGLQRDEQNGSWRGRVAPNRARALFAAFAASIT